MSCSTLQEQTPGSLPNASQVSLHNGRLRQVLRYARHGSRYSSRRARGACARLSLLPLRRHYVADATPTCGCHRKRAPTMGKNKWETEAKLITRLVWQSTSAAGFLTYPPQRTEPPANLNSSVPSLPTDTTPTNQPTNEKNTGTTRGSSNKCTITARGPDAVET